MNDRISLEEEFEALVYLIYQKLGYKRVAPLGKSDKEYDFKVTSPDGKLVIVDVKLYHTRIISRELVIRAAMALEAKRQALDAYQAVLVLGSTLNIPVVNMGDTIVVDMTKLREMVAKHPMLAGRLASIARQIYPMPVGNDADILAARILGDAYAPAADLEPPLATLEPRPEPARGKELAAALRRVRAGKLGARQFATKASDALKYLFEQDFISWKLQKPSDTMHRYDLIARIASEHDFWGSIVRYFKTWYVVFEFKNHTRFITQGEVYSTEKYLFVPAMRSVALIISRKGADKNAKAVMRGALRETGKLMLSLSLEDVYKMLEMKVRAMTPIRCCSSYWIKC
jgi:hypothetical protein